MSLLFFSFRFFFLFTVHKCEQLYLTRLPSTNLSAHPVFIFPNKKVREGGVGKTSLLQQQQKAVLSHVTPNFKQKENFPITFLCIIYSILLLQTSVSLHIYLVKIQQAQFAALRRWQLTWAANRVKCYFKKALSAHVSMPLIARSAARICCRTPQWRLMPPGPKFGSATFVLSIQSAVLSEFRL